ncbi:phage baseplate assembly protein V [Oligoflexus tunisiensis]|uniref:phage baseplate assembly protein V n=1 Tax=Oligoflexus tunisiensis TaxID=708132 RepID=UPI000A5B12F5|nr:phage baseplate assembly protein V [Oligoflexus tunisiensis]
MLEIAVADIMRRLENLLRPGTIAEVDHAKAKVKVRLSSEHTTGWLSYFARRAGNTISWDPPEIGEQVLVLSPGGELASGFALTGIYSGSRPAPSKSGDLHLARYSDGLECSYDTKSNTLVIQREKDLNIRVKATRIDFDTKKASIRNEKGELIALVSQGLKSVAQSQTATMMGPQKLLPAATELIPITQNLDSFTDAADDPSPPPSPVGG